MGGSERKVTSFHLQNVQKRSSLLHFVFIFQFIQRQPGSDPLLHRSHEVSLSGVQIHLLRTARAGPSRSATPAGRPAVKRKHKQNDSRTPAKPVLLRFSRLPGMHLGPQSSVCPWGTGSGPGGDLHKPHPPAGDAGTRQVWFSHNTRFYFGVIISLQHEKSNPGSLASSIPDLCRWSVRCNTTSRHWEQKHFCLLWYGSAHWSYDCNQIRIRLSSYMEATCWVLTWALTFYSGLCLCHVPRSHRSNCECTTFCSCNNSSLTQQTLNVSDGAASLLLTDTKWTQEDFCGQTSPNLTFLLDRVSSGRRRRQTFQGSRVYRFVLTPFVYHWGNISAFLDVKMRHHRKEVWTSCCWLVAQHGGDLAPRCSVSSGVLHQTRWLCRPTWSRNAAILFPSCLS